MKKVFKSLAVLGIYFLYQEFIVIATLNIIKYYYLGFFDNFKIIILLLMDITFISLIVLIYLKELIKAFKNVNLKDFKIGFQYWSIGFITMIASNFLINIFLKSGMSENEESIRLMLPKYPLYIILSIVIFAPILEEIIFRKTIRDLFKNDYLFVTISGLLFGLIHLSIGFNSLIDLLYIIPYGGLGVAFALTLMKTKNISICILLHCFHNTLVLIIVCISTIFSRMVG